MVRVSGVDGDAGHEAARRRRVVETAEVMLHERAPAAMTKNDVFSSDIDARSVGLKGLPG